MRAPSITLLSVLSLTLPCLSVPLTSQQCTAASQQRVEQFSKRTRVNASNDHKTGNLTGGAHAREYRVSYEYSANSMQTISASYLQGFFTTELRTHVRDALVYYGPDADLPVKEWIVKTEEFTEPRFQTPKFQVTCAPTVEQVYLPLSFIRDFFDQAPFWIIHREDWYDNVYKTINVEVLDELPFGDTHSVAKCSIDSWVKLGTWGDDEIVISETLLPQNAIHATAANNTINTVTKRAAETSDCAWIPLQSSTATVTRKFDFTFENTPRKPPPSINSAYLQGFFTKVTNTLLKPELAKFGPNYVIPSDRYFVEVPDKDLGGLPKFYVHLYGLKNQTSTFTLDLVRDFYARMPGEIVKQSGWDDQSWRIVDVDILDMQPNGQYQKTGWAFLHAVGDTSRWIDEPVELSAFGKNVRLDTDMSNITALFDSA